MYCSGCGQALVAGQGFCPRCGLAGNPASGFRTPMAGGPLNVYPIIPPVMQVERRVNALAFGWLIYGATSAVLGLAGLAFAHAWFGQFGGFDSGRSFGNHFPFVWGMPFWVHFATAALLLRVGLALAAGVGLLQKAAWGRWVAIIAAVLSLIHIPFGTAIGIWTLVVLLNRQNAWTYEAMAG